VRYGGKAALKYMESGGSRKASMVIFLSVPSANEQRDLNRIKRAKGLSARRARVC
jgi:hypothetical protein